jgi:hypothetical protein
MGNLHFGSLFTLKKECAPLLAFQDFLFSPGPSANGSVGDRGRRLTVPFESRMRILLRPLETKRIARDYALTRT